MNGRPLTARQKRFLAAYLDEASPTRGNASASAAAAGFKSRPNAQGARMLSNDSIAAAIAAYEQAVADAVLARGIAVRTNRVAILQDLAERGHGVIIARAAAAGPADAPGAATGLMVRTTKWVKRYQVRIRETPDYAANEIGEDEDPEHVAAREWLMPDGTQLVEEWAVDTATSAELRATLKQAAQELGQWEEKSQVVTHDASVITIEVVAPGTLDP